MSSQFPQQASFGHFGAPRQHPRPQHGQKAEAQAPVSMPGRSWEPRPGH